MPRRRDERPRVLGPSKARGGYRVTTVDPGADGGRGERLYRYFALEEEANTWKGLQVKKLARLNGTTVDSAIDAYNHHLQEKGLKDKSRVETVRRMRAFFPADELLNRITLERAKKLYASFRDGRSVDYHRNTLAETKTFMRWCVKESLLPASPIEQVEGVGRRSKGKVQLTADEAFRFAFAALWKTNAGDLGALGAACLLYMGLRQSEVWKRRVRDLDRSGTVLRIEDAKTKAGERQVRMPELLQPYLVELTRGRLPAAPLFPAADGGHHTKSWLRCAVKRVCVAAGVPVVTPHGLRGTFASLGEREHVASDVVAGAIGHAGMSAYGSYAQAGAVQDAAQERALRVISGGKR